MTFSRERPALPAGRVMDPAADLTEQITAAVRAAILSGELSPGARLTQQELARTLGASRTPVRKALDRLRMERLVVDVGPKTMVVRPMDRERLAEAFQVRIALEQLAVRLVVENLSVEILERSRQALRRIEQLTHENLNDEEIGELLQANREFHGTIDGAVGNEYLGEMIAQVRDETRRYAVTLLPQLYRRPGRAERELGEHRGILRALEERDGESAARLMANHLSRSAEELLEVSLELERSAGRKGLEQPAGRGRTRALRRFLSLGPERSPAPDIS